MKKLLVMISAMALLAGCDDLAPSVREQQAQRNANLAQQVDFSAGNAEAANILRRAQLVSQPDLTGYVVLMAMGRPVAYYTVQGKITSSGKRLEPGQINDCSRAINDYMDGVPCVGALAEAPSYDGTFGRSDEYIYFWTTSGQYIQWSTGGGNGYLYSDQPLQPNGAAAAALVSTPENAQ